VELAILFVIIIFQWTVIYPSLHPSNFLLPSGLWHFNSTTLSLLLSVWMYKLH
jgi:hypothetical protein